MKQQVKFTINSKSKQTLMLKFDELLFIGVGFFLLSSEYRDEDFYSCYFIKRQIYQIF